MESIETRVARGATALDATRPGWHTTVNLDRLDLDSCVWCVIGQLAGHVDQFREVFPDWPLARTFINNPDHPMLTHGFWARENGGITEYSHLTTTWKAEILQRRETPWAI